MFRVAASLMVVSLMFLGAPGCGKGGKTPEQTFDEMAEAAKKEDGKAMMATMTRDSQKVLTGIMVLALMNIKEGDEVLKKHSVDIDRVGEKQVGTGADAAAVVTSMKEIADFVKDGPGFVHDSIAVMKKADPKSSPATGMSGAKIKNVKVEGDKARGTTEIEGKSVEIQFAKEDGTWKIDLVPFLTAAMTRGPN